MPNRAALKGRFEVIQINPNCWDGVKAWLLQEGTGAGRVVCAQEHKLNQSALDSACEAMAKQGYCISGAPAVTTKQHGDGRHRSAGTLVAVAAHVHSELLCAFGKADLSPSEAPGRLTGRWVDWHGGVAVFAAYFEDGTGWSATNIALAHQLGMVTAVCGVPWIVALDGNMDPADFVQAQTIHDMPGYIVRSEEGTCRYKESWKCYDYFYVHNVLEAFVVGAERLEDWPTVPHKPVRLSLTKAPTSVNKRVQIAPLPLPYGVPIGCARAPSVRPRLIRETVAGGTVPSMDIDATYAAVIGQVEADVLDTHGIGGDEARKFSGRGKPLTFRLVPTLPKRRRNTMPSATITLHVKRVAAVAKEVYHILAKCTTHGMSAGRKCQLDRIVARMAPKIVNLRSQQGNEEVTSRWAWELASLRHLLAAGWLDSAWPAAWHIGEAAHAEAQQLSEADRAQADASAKAFFTRLSTGSASGLHKATKVTKHVEALPLERQGELQPLRVVARKLEFWSAEWRIGDRSVQDGPRPWLHGTDEGRDLLEPMQADRIMEASKAFKEGTALKVDIFHPRVLENAAEDTCEDVAALFQACEVERRWPEQVALTVYVMLPKEGGGDRPIGIMAGWVRLWERARLPDMKIWLQSATRPYDYAQVGCTAESAVWLQLLEGEALGMADGPREPGMVTILCDLVKCFERIKLRHIWHWALHWRMPRGLLRMILVTYSMDRRLCALGCYSDPTRTLSAIVPGSVFALAVLHSMLIQPVDELLTAWRPSTVTIAAAKYVDDIAITVRGVSEDLIGVAFAVFDNFVHFLEQDLDFEVSLNEADETWGARPVAKGKKGKTKAIVSSKWLHDKMKARWTCRGVDMVASAPNLGIIQKGFGKLATRARCSRGKRAKAVRARKGKIEYAKRHGGRVQVVAQRAIVPALQYGARVVGTPPSQLAAMQRYVAAALPGRQFGRSRALRLATYDADPAPAVVALPIVAWASAVWDKTCAPITLMKAWRIQTKRMRANPSWLRVIGPTSATILQSAMCGWGWPVWHTFTSAEGLVMDMRKTCPRDIAEMAKRDFENLQWQAWIAADSDRASLGPAPMMEPVARWFKKRKCGPGGATAAQAVAAGMWTQQKAHRHRAPGADTDECRACLDAGRRSWKWDTWSWRSKVGDAQHRLGHCPTFTTQRKKQDRVWQHQVANSSDRLLWDRGLVANPALRYAYHQQPADTRWEDYSASDDGAGAVFTGDVASDGSRIGNWRDLGQTGWAAAMLGDGDRADSVVLVAWGPLPTELPVQRRIARAELYGVLRVLEHALPPIRVHVDCMVIISGVANGKHWCCHSSRPHADVWRLVWAKLDDIGISDEAASLHKVAAHVSKAKRDAAESVTRRLLVANDEADRFAKRGALASTNEFLGYINQAVEQKSAQVKGALSHIAGMAEQVAHDYDGGWPDVVKLPRGTGAKPKARPKPAVVVLHSFEDTSCGERCRNCFALRGDSLGACTPHPAARLAHQSLGGYAVANAHRLWRTGPYIWCIRCAMHTSCLVRNLASTCTGQLEHNKWRRDNLLEGKPPKTRRSDAGRTASVGVAHRITVDEWLGWSFAHTSSGNAALRELAEADGVAAAALLELRLSEASITVEQSRE